MSFIWLASLSEAYFKIIWDDFFKFDHLTGFIKWFMNGAVSHLSAGRANYITMFFDDYFLFQKILPY